MNDDDIDDDAPALYISFDEASLSNTSLANRVKACQSKNNLSSYWVEEANVLILQGPEDAMLSAQEEINHFAGCEAAIYTDEELHQMNETQVEQGDFTTIDPDNNLILAVYPFASKYLKTIKNSAAPSQLIPEFASMAAASDNVQKRLMDVLNQASKTCHFKIIPDTSKSSVLMISSPQDIATLQNHLKDSYATVTMTIAQYEKGLQPWEVLKHNSPALH